MASTPSAATAGRLTEHLIRFISCIARGRPGCAVPARVLAPAGGVDHGTSAGCPTTGRAGRRTWSEGSVMSVTDCRAGLRADDTPGAPHQVMAQANETDLDAPVVSVTVTVTSKVPAVVGVPEIRPNEGLIDSPAGSPAVV